jgi:hypothetical protein
MTTTIEHRDPERVITAAEAEAALTPAQRAERDANLARQTVAATLTADTTADLAKVLAAITDLQTLLGDETVTNSIRQVMGPTGAVAGTGSLRALKAQSSSAVVAAASIKALIDLTTTLAQRVIDDAQATRKVARQTLRLARLQVSDLTSSNVGPE